MSDATDLRELAARARENGTRVAISPDAADRIADMLARHDPENPDPHASAEWEELVHASHQFGYALGRLDEARKAYTSRFPVSRSHCTAVNDRRSR